MMWSDTHFPAAMRSLNPSTRAKAIEIANRLVAQGDMTKQQAITVSISEARRMARLSYSGTDAAGLYSSHSR
ncbi:DUF2188 domain-containing protein [Rudanella paleaurantiibacter]|nr:hypothetical protein [Rudanella paleaurantiibacter]